MIIDSDTVIYPWAVMIEPFYTMIASATMS